MDITKNCRENSELIARKTPDNREQSLTSHLNGVANLLELFEAESGSTEHLHLTPFFRLLGLNHDIGKSSPEFQNYIKNGGKRGSAPHSAVGGRKLYDELSGLCGEIGANAICGHHGHLYDGVTPRGDLGLAVSANLSLKKDVTARDKELCDALGNTPDKPFALNFLCKYIYSCLVDADRLDAQFFEEQKEYTYAKNDFSLLLSRLDHYLESLVAETCLLSDYRREVSEACYVSAGLPKGLFRLSVPTGGGKTLSSLRFAFAHIAHHNMSRVIYVIPYLSIVEQTAKELKKALDINDDSDILLEHHGGDFQSEIDDDAHRQAAQRWDSPIILTTMVQFLESCFSHKASKLRKFHNLKDSVIIFDEIQQLPTKCVHLFNGLVDFLIAHTGCTVVLCSATQPPLETADRPIVSTPTELCRVTPPSVIRSRTRIVNSIKQNGYTPEELARFILDLKKRSVLAVMNTKRSAMELYVSLKDITPAEIKLFHLSTNMCPEHRSAVLSAACGCLNNHTPLILVSTQLIEAGVDISFECVVRGISGYDSIIQAAGRCNRKGEFEQTCDVHIVSVKDENLDKLPEIKIGAELTERCLREKPLSSDCSFESYVELYYKYYYGQKNLKAKMDYITDDGTIYDMLSCNRGGVGNLNNKGGMRPHLVHAFQSAGERFSVIESIQTPVVVPYGKSEELLCNLDSHLDASGLRKLYKRLSRVSVNVFEYQKKILEEAGAIYAKGEILVLKSGYYEDTFGLYLNGKDKLFII